MSAHHCSFCNAFSSGVEPAIICPSCAKGRIGDKWCDFCNKTTITEPAFICRKCVKGRLGDQRCDFCNGTRGGAVAQICRNCKD